MPSGFVATGKVFSKRQGRWIPKDLSKAFDYENLDISSGAFIVSFFRWYPDALCDICRSETAKYNLELPQRMILRIIARYRNAYITGCRGLTKTYCILLGKMIKGILWPGERMRYTAPAQKQAAALATQAFHQIESDYPIIASHWAIRNDAQDMFKITTIYGSEFTMYSPRGDNCNETIAEEIGQEGKDPFDMEKYEQDVLPTCRIERTVNQMPDRFAVQLQHSHISNACAKQNRAYYVHRESCMKDMLHGELFEGFVIDFSWITALMGNLRNIAYIKDQRSKLTPAAWKREMCALYTGDSKNPLIPDETLSASRVLPLMEDRHCGDPNAIYIVAHDVSYVDDAKNAKCADVVLKLTAYEDFERRDKYRKQVVYVDNYPPPKTAYEQAMRVRELWEKFCLSGGQTTYIVVDAQAYGTEVVEELMKPTANGRPNLCCVDHAAFTEIEQPGSLPIIYPMKAGTRGSRDPDADMISYAQVEFEFGNVELLIPNVLDGVEAYKTFHRIKDARFDAMISNPYRQSELLCQQIANLQTEVSGMTLKEKRKSKALQRDIWSALKYALRMAQKLESEDKAIKYGAKSTWAERIAEAGKRPVTYAAPAMTGGRANVLAMRSKVR